MKGVGLYIGQFPQSLNDIPPIATLARQLLPLIGTALPKTGKDRTDGANLRKMYTKFLGFKLGKGSSKQNVIFYTKKNSYVLQLF